MDGDSNKPLRVVIVSVPYTNFFNGPSSTDSPYRGAGIGGLSLSSGLGFLAKQRNLQIDIYEAASNIWEIGAGINVWPRTWNVFKALGLEENLLRLLPRAPDNSTRNTFFIRRLNNPSLRLRDFLPCSKKRSEGRSAYSRLDYRRFEFT